MVLKQKTDLDYIFNPYKPFMYDLVNIDNKIVPLQIKNSEYVLLPSMAKSNPELQKVLDKLDYIRNEIGLNGSLQFNSTIKVGEYNTSENVDSISDYTILNNSEYRIQGEVPEHQIDTDNLLGTQLRKIITGDLDKGGTYTLPTGEDMNGQEVKDELNNILVADVKTNAANLRERFKDKNEFYKIIQEEAISRSYPKKIIDALEPVTKPDGAVESKVPLYSPLISRKFQALYASIYRNAITKLKFPGASLPNYTSYGLKRKPKIIFNKDNSIKYLECYIPMTSSWLKSYMDKEGILNTKELEKIGLDLGVVYRIPTEGKYSIVPIKVIGFVNSGIILPPQITSLTGLDFDIDKMYAMLYSFDIVNGKPVKSAWKTEFTYDEYKNGILNTKKAKQLLQEYDTVENVLNQAEGLGPVLRSLFQTTSKEDILEEENILLSPEQWNKLSLYEKNTKKARDNRKLDLIIAVLTNPHTAPQQLDGGNFDRLEALVNEINPNKKEINPLLASHRAEVFGDIFAGRALIGIGANYVATHQLMQDQNLTLTEPIRFNGQEASNIGMKYVVEYEREEKFKKEDIEIDKVYDVFGNNREVYQIKDNKVYHRSTEEQDIDDRGIIIETIDSFLDKLNIKQLTGKIVTSELAQFNASFVDNGKNPLAGKYNMNTYTADVAMLITKLYGMETAMRFISHPAIKNFYDKYILYGGNYKAEQKAIKEVFPNMKFKGDRRTPPVNIDDKILIDKTHGDDVLQAFIYFKKNQAQELSDLVTAMKVADNGMSATIEGTILSLDTIYKTSDLKGIANVAQYFTNSNLHTTLMIEYGIDEPLDRLKDEFGFPEYRGGAYKSVRDYFSSQKTSGKLNEDEMKIVHDTMMNYMSSDFQPLTVLSRKDLVTKIVPIFDNAKVANTEAKSNYKKFFGSIKKETSRIDDSLTILKLSTGITDNIENDIIQEWELMIGDSKTIPNTQTTYSDFAKMMVQYAFNTKGFRFGPGSFSQVKPIDFYDSVKDGSNKSFNDHIKNGIQMANADIYSMDNFKEQFIRNYFPRLSFVRTIDIEQDRIVYSKDKTQIIGIRANESFKVLDWWIP